MISQKIVKENEREGFINSIFDKSNIFRYREKRKANIPMIIMEYLMQGMDNKIMFEVIKTYEYYRKYQ